MASKRPLDRKPTTDEWGLYDPAEAGMPALFARLGRPVLRQSDAAARREKRRAARPQRSTEGVCLAIEEVKRRARNMAQAAVPPPEPPDEGSLPAAIELVRRGRKDARARVAAAAEPKTAAHDLRDALLDAEMNRSAALEPTATARVAESKAPAARATAKTATAKAQRELAAPASAKTRSRKSPRVKAATRPAEPAVERMAAPARIPAPSPRRPRGPVPLAAWAHAVTDAPSPAPAPARHDTRGLWRSLFRIPSEVALVEYGRGCKIHRLVIETNEPAETF